MRVLVADDSPEVLERLVAQLRGVPGIEGVHAARDGEEALGMFSQLQPDAVVLDLRMPKMSGLEVLKIVKTRRPATLVFILSNYAFSQYGEACLAANADFFFDKSREFEKVGETLARRIEEFHESV